MVAGCSDFGGRPDQTGPPGVEQVGWGTRGQQATIHLLSELGRAPLFGLGRGWGTFREIWLTSRFYQFSASESR